MSVDRLLSRLRRVRRVGPGKWMTSCPTREDKSPSLAIRETEDGTILIHDFGSDDVESILAAVGLTFADLYPKRQGYAAKPIKRVFNASDVLDLVAFESSVAVMVASDVLHERAVTEEDFDRLLTAAQRLGDAAEVCNGPR